MKIVCCCGSESKFVAYDSEVNNKLREDEGYKKNNVNAFGEINGEIFINSDHDGLYFICENCNRTIYCRGAQYGCRKRRIV